MFWQRVLVTAVLLPLGIAAVILGGIYYFLLVTVFIVLAAVEYVQMFRQGGHQPAGVLVVGGILLMALGRAYDGFNSAPWIASLLILLSMAYHLFSYERGRDQAATDFCLSLGGIFYLGWIGSYFISLRDLPDGAWWFWMALGPVLFADSIAYAIGKNFGRHKLSPRLSPKKTWEGYWAGVVAGTLSGLAIGAIFQAWMGLRGYPTAPITPLHGLLMGMVMSVLTTLGDLGESMFKRQLGFKDSGSLLPGHGGFFDRVDAWLWAMVIGYYMAVWFIK